MNQRVEPYRESEHYAALCAWWIARGGVAEPADALPGGARPGLGFVVPGVAACFVYLTGTSVAFIHQLVANPAAPRRAQARALDAVVGACIQGALQAGARWLLGYTRQRHIVRRARRHGFRAWPAATIGLDLEAAAHGFPYVPLAAATMQQEPMEGRG